MNRRDAMRTIAAATAAGTALGPLAAAADKELHKVPVLQKWTDELSPKPLSFDAKKL